MYLRRTANSRVLGRSMQLPKVCWLLVVLTAVLVSGCIDRPKSPRGSAARKNELLHEPVHDLPRDLRAKLTALRQKEDLRRENGKWPVVDKLDSVPVNQRLIEELWYNNFNQDMYVQESKGVSLKSGGLTDIAGLEVQRLRFRLPWEHRRSWSKDGKTLYVVSSLIPEVKQSTYPYISQVLRIDTTKWTATHAMRLQFPRGVSVPITGTEVTSEGLLVAVRGRYALEFYALGERGKEDNPTTGVMIDHLALFDPNTLELKRLFVGPSKEITGSPNSSVVCVSGLDVIAALVDLRDGTVLDRIDLANRDDRIPGVKELKHAAMSPDGDMVYFDTTHGEVLPFDISEGRFKPTKPLPYSGNTDPLSHCVHVSPDGSQVGVVCRGKIVVMPTTEFEGPPGIDAPLPLEVGSELSSDMTFVGSTHRIACNASYEGRDYYVYRDLVIDEGRYELQEEIPVRQPIGLQTSISGTPFSDHVLVGVPPGVRVSLGELKTNAMTLWVRLPPEAPEPEPPDHIEIMPAKIRGATPNDPLQLLDRPLQGRRDEGEGLARVYIPDAKQLACSPDGSLVYVLDEHGLLRAFDTVKLREVRRATIPLNSEYEHFRLLIAKSGLLVGNETEPWTELLNFTTLDGEIRFDVDINDIRAASPSSNLVRVRSEIQDLVLYDVAARQLAYRLGNRTAAKLTGQRRNGRSNSGVNFGESAIADSGRVILAQCDGVWHCFEIDPNSGWKHLGYLKGSGRLEEVFPVSVSDRRLCYCLSDSSEPGIEKYVRVYDLDSLPEPVKKLASPRGGPWAPEAHRGGGAEVLATAPNGWLYLGVEDLLIVYDDSGRDLFGSTLTADYGNHVAPVPGRPSRVFTLGKFFSVSDLDQPEDHFAGLRIWTSGKHQAVAKLLEADKNDAILLSLEEKTMVVPLERLSEEDREFIEAQKNRRKRRRR